LWRVDKPVECRLADGAIKITQQKTRAMWWSRRKLMYMYLEVLLEQGQPIQEIIKQGEIIFNSARIEGKGQRRPQLAHLQTKFVQVLTEMGHRTGKRGSGAQDLVISDKEPEMPNKKARIINPNELSVNNHRTQAGIDSTTLEEDTPFL
jgi:hypothetical protein